MTQRFLKEGKSYMVFLRINESLSDLRTNIWMVRFDVFFNDTAIIYLLICDFFGYCFIMLNFRPFEFYFF